ncbi:hypothetical protein MPER_06296 [Moniliophthora perniciosa FA553]|nr:hypothetical protein MPER_06296 [Moniliophthora perniciosa FA553]
MRAGASVKVQLQLMEDLKTALPKIQKIWAHSPSAVSGRDNTIKKNLKYEAEIRRLLAAGTLTQEDR